MNRTLSVHPTALTGQNLFRITVVGDRTIPLPWLAILVIVSGGALLRFWGLGDIGLHGDEDVMGLATRGLRQTGWPVIPSGMDYVRALPQLYLMAWSTGVFGDTEWALRLPSALIGSFGVLVAYWLGRRFLSVNWSLLFTLTIALLPALISISQTARMYIFYVTLVMLFAVAIFRWERTESHGAFALALAACLLALSFHALTVFSALLFLYPGILKPSFRTLGLGIVALVGCVIFQQEHSAWVGSHYFDLVELESADGSRESAPLARKFAISLAAVGIFIVAAAAVIAFVIARRRRISRDATVWFVLSTACLASTAMLAYMVQYHLAGLAFILGTVLFVRAGFSIVLPVLLGVVLIVMFGIHGYLSWQLPGVQSTLDLLERLAGSASPKTYLSFATFAPLAIVFYVAALSYFFGQFARGYPLPDHVLFFLLAVFAPLFVMGFLSEEYVPQRYVIGFLPFFALSVFAAISELLSRCGENRYARAPGAQVAIAVVLLVWFVGPRDLWYNVNPRHEDFQHLSDARGVDHKGAAQFILSQHLDQDDIVIAVDTQQQAYYLGGRVDYYMRAIKDSRNSSFMRDGRMLSLYSGVEQISTGEKLASVLSNAKIDEVFIVGSGELQGNGREKNLGDGLWQTMEDFGLEEVYRGKDGATRVWRHSTSSSSAPHSQPVRGDVGSTEPRQ